MESNKHIVIFSHGFGVRKDDVGLLTEIAEFLPEVESVMFDYNEIDEVNYTLTVAPLSKQVVMLNEVISTAKSKYPEAVVDLIGHSQGTIVCALAKPAGIRKTILLAPVFDMTIERTMKRYGNDPEAEINLDGVSKFPPYDGFARFVPAQYWAERKDLKPFDLYNDLTKLTDVIVIEANQDQILEKVDLQELSPKITVTALDGDHNFTGSARQPLIQAIRTRSCCKVLL